MTHLCFKFRFGFLRPSLCIYLSDVYIFYPIVFKYVKVSKRVMLIVLVNFTKLDEVI